MIDIPVADIKAKIKEQKGLSDDEIDTKIQSKLQQLAGLISEDGAAHIIANELGVTIVKEAGEAKINDLYAGMRNVTVPGKVTRKFDVRSFDKNGRKGKVGSFFIGDETGQVRVTLWNDQTDLFEQFAEGDVVRVKNAYVKENRGFKELHLNTDSKLQIKPSDVTVGEVKASSRPDATRKQIKDLAGDEENIELLATVVQVYDPRFFNVHPDTGKRVDDSHDGPTQTNYVLNAFLDDGTGNIRTTFWKNQIQHLTGKTDAEMLQYQENPQAFEEVKTDLLGEIVKIVGRCKKNDMFDRVEMTANVVLKDVDPEEELAKLQSETPKATTVKETAPEPSPEKPDTPEPTPKAETTEPAEPAARAESAAAPAEPDAAPAEPTPSQPEEESLPTTGAKEEEPENESTDIEAGVKQDVKDEDVISLDDLEDLDEKL